MADSEVRQKFEAFAKLEIGKYPSLYDLPDPFKIGPEDEYFEDAVAFALAAWRAGEIARWIPVEEKLPDENCWVRTLEKMTAGSQRVRFFCARLETFWETGSCPDTNVTYFVTHWQPLPAAPEEKVK